MLNESRVPCKGLADFPIRLLGTGPVCMHTWPIFALFWQLTFRNVEVFLVFFRKLHSYINQKFSYYCHFLHWQRPFKILLCVISVNESFIDLHHRFIVFKAGCSTSTRIRIRCVCGFRVCVFVGYVWMERLSGKKYLRTYKTYNNGLL